MKKPMMKKGTKKNVIKKAGAVLAKKGAKKGMPKYGKKKQLAKKKGPSCWKGYVAKGKKKSPSGKKTRGGKAKMVNNCVKKKR